MDSFDTQEGNTDNVLHKIHPGSVSEDCKKPPAVPEPELVVTIEKKSKMYQQQSHFSNRITAFGVTTRAKYIEQINTSKCKVEQFQLTHDQVSAFQPRILLERIDAKSTTQCNYKSNSVADKPFGKKKNDVPPILQNSVRETRLASTENIEKEEQMALQQAYKIYEKLIDVGKLLNSTDLDSTMRSSHQKELARYQNQFLRYLSIPSVSTYFQSSLQGIDPSCSKLPPPPMPGGAVKSYLDTTYTSVSIENCSSSAHFKIMRDTNTHETLNCQQNNECSEMELNLQKELMEAALELERLIPSHQRKIETYSENVVIKCFQQYSSEMFNSNLQLEENLTKINEKIILLNQDTSTNEISRNLPTSSDNVRPVKKKQYNEPTNIAKTSKKLPASSDNIRSIVYNGSIYDECFEKFRLKYNLKFVSVNLSRIDEKIVLAGGVSNMLQSSNKRKTEKHLKSVSRKSRHIAKQTDKIQNIDNLDAISYSYKLAQNAREKNRTNRRYNLNSERLASTHKQTKATLMFEDLHDISNNTSTCETRELPTLDFELDKIAEDMNEDTNKKWLKFDQPFQRGIILSPDGYLLPPNIYHYSSSNQCFRTPSTSILPSLPLNQNTPVFHGFPHMNISYSNQAPECHSPEGQPAPGFIKDTYPDGGVKEESITLLENKFRLELEALNMKIEAWKSWKKAGDLQAEYWRKKNTKENTSETVCKNCMKKISTENLNKSNIEYVSENSTEIVISEVMPNFDIKIEEQDIC